MRLLICGDRNGYNTGTIEWWIRELRPDIIIEGEGRGVDIQAGLLAFEMNIPTMEFPANWTKYRKAAGPIRNQQMLDEGKPCLVLAFHTNIENSKGTADMLTRAADAKINYALID